MKLKTHSRIMGAVQGTLWLLVGAGFGGVMMFPNFAVDGKISGLASFLFIIGAAFFGGVIAAFGGVNTARLDYSNGKIVLGPEELERAAKLPPPLRPMFLVPLLDTTLQWLGVAAVSALVAFVVFPQGLSRLALILSAGLIMSAHGALAAWRNSGRELLKYAGHPPAPPTTFGSYLLREHVSGNGLINLAINPLVGYIAFHQGPKHPEVATKLELVMVDLLVMCVMVAVLVPIGAAMQAATDVLENRATSRPAASPGFLLRGLSYIGLALAAFLLFVAVCYLLGIADLNLVPIMTLKGIISGLLGAVVAALAAHWSAARTQTLREQKNGTTGKN